MLPAQRREREPTPPRWVSNQNAARACLCFVSSVPRVDNVTWKLVPVGKYQRAGLILPLSALPLLTIVQRRYPLPVACHFPPMFTLTCSVNSFGASVTLETLIDTADPVSVAPKTSVSRFITSSRPLASVPNSPPTSARYQ